MKKNPEAGLLARCGWLRVDGRQQEALALLASAPESLPILILRVEIYNELGDLDNVLLCCEHARNFGTPPALLFIQGFTLMQIGRERDAIAVFDSLSEIQPDYPNAAWIRAGLIRQIHGDQHPDTLTAYETVLTLDPDNLFVRVEYADILRGHGRYVEAREIYEAVFTSEACPEEALRVEAAFNLGCVALVMEDSTAAHAAFRFVLDAAPDYPDAQAMHDLTTI